MNESKRIALVASAFLPVPNVEGGAVEYLCTELLRGNETYAKNFEIDVYTKSSPKLSSVHYDRTNIIQVDIPVGLYLTSKFYNLCNKILKNPERKEPYNEALIKKYMKKEYDYIVVENGMYVYRDIIKRTKYKHNVFFHLHNDFDQVNYTEKLAKVIEETATGIIVVSEYLKQSFIKRVPSNKISVLYNCVDTELFDFRKKYSNKSLEYKKKFHIEPDDIVVMFSGRINRVKGVLELVRAFASIDNPHLKLLIVGSCWYGQRDNDEYTQQLKKESSDVADRVIFTGFVEHQDMPYIYSVADILAIPSMWEEPFGLVVSEGMAMKLPIIATLSGAIPELLDARGSVLLPKDNNLIPALSDAILGLAADKNKRNIMGENNYIRIINELKIDNKEYFGKLVDIIEKSDEH